MRGWTKPRWVLGSQRTANGNRHQPQTLNGMSRDLEGVQKEPALQSQSSRFRAIAKPLLASDPERRTLPF